MKPERRPGRIAGDPLWCRSSGAKSLIVPPLFVSYEILDEGITTLAHNASVTVLPDQSFSVAQWPLFLVKANEAPATEVIHVQSKPAFVSGLCAWTWTQRISGLQSFVIGQASGEALDFQWAVLRGSLSATPPDNITFETIGEGPTAIPDDVETTVLADVAFGSRQWPLFSAYIDETLVSDTQHYPDDTRVTLPANACAWSWALKPTNEFDFNVRQKTAAARTTAWTALRVTLL